MRKRCYLLHTTWISSKELSVFLMQDGILEKNAGQLMKKIWMLQEQS